MDAREERRLNREKLKEARGIQGAPVEDAGQQPSNVGADLATRGTHLIHTLQVNTPIPITNHK
jgi:hypothetical protein